MIPVRTMVLAAVGALTACAAAAAPAKKPARPPAKAPVKNTGGATQITALEGDLLAR